MPGIGGYVRFLPLRLAMVDARKRTLVRALQVLRSRERLAAALQVTLEELESYLEGDQPLPDQAFMIASDIVATGTDGTQ